MSAAKEQAQNCLLLHSVRRYWPLKTEHHGKSSIIDPYPTLTNSSMRHQTINSYLSVAVNIQRSSLGLVPVQLPVSRAVLPSEGFQLYCSFLLFFCCWPCEKFLRSRIKSN